MLRLRNPSPEDLDPPPAYTDSDPAFSPDPMDNPHLYTYAMDTANADAKRSHLPRALIDDEKSRLKRAHKNTASTSASAAAAAAMTEEKTKRPPVAVHNNHNHQHHSHQHLSPPPPRITVTPSSATSTSTMATSSRTSFVSSSFSSSSSSFSRLSPPSLYTGSPNSQTSLATSTGGSSPSSSPEAPPVKMPPASSLLSPPPPTKTAVGTVESKPMRPAITPLAPRRSRSVPRGGHGGASYDLDRIDELDESDPLGMAFHHGGPYEAIRAQRLNSPSSKKEEKQLWPGQHEWQKLPSNQQFSLDAPLGLKPGQILPMEIKRMYDTGVVAPPPPPSSSSSSLSSAAAGGMHSHDRQYLQPPPPQDARHPYRSAQAPPPPPASSSSGTMVNTHTDGTAYMRSHIAPSALGEREKHHYQQQQQQPQVQYGDYHRVGRSLQRHVIPEDSTRPKVVGVQPLPPPPPPSHALALTPATGHVHHPAKGLNTNVDAGVPLLSSAAAAAQDRFDTAQERQEEEDVHARALAHVKSSYSIKQQHARTAEIADSVSIPQQVVTQPIRAAIPMITHVPEEEDGDEQEVSELAYMRAGATPSPAPVQQAMHTSMLAAAGLSTTSSRADRAHSPLPSSSGRQQLSSVPEATEHVVITVPVRSPPSHEYASLHPQPSFHSQQTSSSTSSSSAAHSRQVSEPAYPSSAHHQYHHHQQQDTYRTANNLSPALAPLAPGPPPAQPPTRAHTVSYQRTPAQQQPVQMRAAAIQQSAIPPPDIRMPAPSIAPTASSTRSRQPAHVPKRLVMPTPLNPAAQGSIALANAAALHAQQQQHQPHAEAFLTQHHVHFNEQQQSKAKDSAAYVARAREIPMADGSRKVLRKRTVTGAEQDHHNQQQQQQLQQQQQSRGRSLSLSFGRGKEKGKEDKRLGHAHSHSHSHSPSPLQQLPQQVQAQPLQPIVQRQQVQYQQQHPYPYQYQQQQQQQQRQAAPQIRSDIMTYAPSKEPWIFHNHNRQQAQQHTQAPVATAAKATTRAHASQALPSVQRNGSAAAKNMVPSQIDSSPWVHVSPVLHPVKGLPTTAAVFAVADRREMAPSSKGRRLSKQRRGDA